MDTPREMPKAEEQQLVNEELAHGLILSMCAPLINMIKLCIAYPSKNKTHAAMPDLVCCIEMIGQHLLPDYCVKHINDLGKLNNMHDHMMYLAHKARKVFHASAISTSINSNQDLEAFKRCIFEILQLLGSHKNPYELKAEIRKFFDVWKKDQQNKNYNCLTKIYNLLGNADKELRESDLAYMMSMYETDFEFLVEDF